jgi:hypothetical protein
MLSFDTKKSKFGQIVAEIENSGQGESDYRGKSLLYIGYIGYRAATG